VALSEQVKSELRQILSVLVNPVRLVFFTQKNACIFCNEQEKLLKELTSLSEKLKLEVYDFVLNGEQALDYKIDKIPATVPIGETDFGIRFYGLTAGYEFTSLIETIIMISTGQTGLDPEFEMLVKDVDKPVHLQVMATLTCPYCPRIVRTANQFAYINPNIRADMVEISEFNYLVQKYNITGVPKTIINEQYSFDGALSAPAVYLEILKAVDPEKYNLIQAQISRSQEVTKEAKIEESHEYEVAIVGAGPAAMSAAVYAARKGLDVALIAKDLGGQINNTASIENYLGFPNVSGAGMAELFSAHLNQHQVAKAIGVNVVKVEKDPDNFRLLTEDNRIFRAKSVIYCAGKEYRRLGVPGEERFIGRGVGFCATCDAPLYRGKRVAVVGGGNSAFTSVRDLLYFASEVHLIHRRNEFSADETLMREVRQAKNVFFHTRTEVREFLGTDKLTGVRLESVDKKEQFDLQVEGVFLEIGLTPNSAPVKDLVMLNERSEIIVSRDQSTYLKGFFAAGDVTDVEEKQIAIAVGQGALAALSAYKYLTENKFVKNKNLIEDWQ